MAAIIEVVICAVYVCLKISMHVLASENQKPHVIVLCVAEARRAALLKVTESRLISIS